MIKLQKIRSSITLANVIFFILVIILVACIIVSSVLVYNSWYKNIGIACVKYMYQYNNLDELNNNMVKLEGIVSEYIFEKITVDDPYRSLMAYFKFKLDPVSVVIWEAKPGYTEFIIKNANIDEIRRFALIYKVSGTKIVEFREIELVDMPNNP